MHKNRPGVSSGAKNFGLVICFVNFEVGLGMGAGGAQLGGVGAHHDVTAVAALPDLDLGIKTRL